MAKPPTSLRRWWPWILLSVVAALFLLDRGFDAFLRARLQDVILKAAGPGYHVEIGQVRARLFQGDLEVHDVSLDHDGLPTDSMLDEHRHGMLFVSADRVHISDLSYTALVLHGSIRVARVEIDAPTVVHILASGKGGSPEPAETGTSEGQEPPALITVDSLIVRNAKGDLRSLDSTSVSGSLGSMDIHMGNVRMVTLADGRHLPMVGSAAVAIADFTLALPPMYDLHIVHVDLFHPSQKVIVDRLSLMPRHDEHEYGKVLEHETDLFQVAVDTLRIRGFNVDALLARGAFHMKKLHMAQLEVAVFRDKTMTDAPWVHKPLPARTLRRAGIPMIVDTLEITNGRATYHERDDLGPKYGSVEFADMSATATGLNTSAEYAAAGGELRVHATARIYDSSAIRLDAVLPMDTANERFTASAYLNSIPFRFFNEMTDELLHVEASDGRIHTLTMHMHGNDRTGKGTVDMEYEDLRIAFRSTGGTVDMGRVRSMLANTVVRRNNLKDRNNYRQGVFEIDRRRDRAIFNFLWNGLKAGSMDTVVPEILRNAAREAQHKEPKR